MSGPPHKRATYEDLLAAPPHLIAELIYGNLVTSPRPASPHVFAASGIGCDLGNPFQRARGGPGGWWILDKPELHLGADVLVPDIAGWRQARMPSMPSVPYFELAPDWLCEVLSPSTEARDRTDKLAIYGAAGVEWVWLLNPTLQTLEVLQLHDGSWVLHSSHRGDTSVRAAPFEAVELALRDWWLPAGPPAPT